MREQSQKSEMAAALRGDFQRLRQRGVSTTLGPAVDPLEAVPAAEPASVAPASARAPASPAATVVAAPVAVAPVATSEPPPVSSSFAAPAPQPDPPPPVERAVELPWAPPSAAAAVPEARRSRLGRLLGRG